MKKVIFTTALFLSAAYSFAQMDIKIAPRGGSVCHNQQVSLDINGTSFTPTSYLWNTGETTPTINITQSGTYTLTVTGYNNNPNNLTTKVKRETFNVLPSPVITALTSLWVCKFDTVKLAADAGYDNISWSTGVSGNQLIRPMVRFGQGTPQLDTLNVSYTATINGVCAIKSETVVLRGIRRPNGVGVAFNGKMNIKTTDSIPAGTVLEYLHPVTYEMQFTDQSDPSNVVTYFTAPGSRRAPANILQQGKTYSVVTRPVINNVSYCFGNASTIGLLSGNRIGEMFNDSDLGVKTFRIFDMSGRMLAEKQAENFNNTWLEQFTPQMFIVHKVGATTEVIKIQLMK